MSYQSAIDQLSAMVPELYTKPGQARRKFSLDEIGILLAALDNRAGPARDIVALNAGASIYIAGLADSLEAGVSQAQQVIASGAARQKIDELSRFTAHYKTD